MNVQENVQFGTNQADVFNGLPIQMPCIKLNIYSLVSLQTHSFYILKQTQETQRFLLSHLFQIFWRRLAMDGFVHD